MGRQPSFATHARIVVGALALAFALLLVAVGCGGDDDAAATSNAAAEKRFSDVRIGYLGFGGTTDEALKQTLFPAFEKSTGARFAVDSPTDYAKIEVQVESKNVSYDLVDGDPYVIDARCGEMWEELDIDLSSIPGQYHPDSKCSAPSYVYGYVLEYSKKAFSSGGPRDCNDFFNLQKFPGKRGIWSYYVSGIVECAAIAAGADPKDPYQSLDLDAAFATLESLKDNIVIYNSTSEAADGMENNDFVMALVTTAQAYNAVSHGAQIAAAPGWAVRTFGALGVPKGAPNKEAAEEFIRYALTKEGQTDFVNELPSNGSLYETAPSSPEWEKIKEFAPWVAPLADVAMDLNSEWWSKNESAVSDRWSDFTAG